MAKDEKNMEHNKVRKAQGAGCAIILFLLIPAIAFMMWGPFGFVISLILGGIIGAVLYYSFMRERGKAEDEPEIDDKNTS